MPHPLNFSLPPPLETVDLQPVEDAELGEGVGAGHHPELLAGLHVLEADGAAMLPPDEVAPPRHAEAQDGHLVGRDSVGWSVQKLVDLPPVRLYSRLGVAEIGRAHV